MECKLHVDENQKFTIANGKKQNHLRAKENLINKKDSSLNRMNFSNKDDDSYLELASEDTNQMDIDPLGILQVVNNKMVDGLFDNISNTNDSQKETVTNDTEKKIVGNKRLKYSGRKLKSDECAICEKKFKFRPDFIKHVQIEHPNAKAFKCKDCSMVFTNINSVSRHRKIHKDMPKKHVCEFCPKSFLNKDTFKRHVAIHYKERSYSCTFCGKTYKNKIYLEHHEKTHIKQQITDDDIDINLIPCSNNQMSFTDKYKEENTVLKIINEELNTNYDSQIIKLSNDEDQILQVKNEEEIFKIEIVEDEFKADQFKDISNTIESQKIYELKKNCGNIRRRKPMLAVDKNCAVCHKEFNFRQDLVKHVKIYHPNAKAYKCNKCSMRFANIDSISRHRRIHKNIHKNNFCPYCPKSFMHKDDFSRHLATHNRNPVNKSKPAVDRKCAVCHEEFDMRQDLIEHAKKFHPDCKSFKCGICPKVFTNIHYISRHRRIHKNLPLPKRHVCDVCCKAFSFKESLKRHLITHTRRTSYSCSLCLKSYKHKISLENHKKIHFQTESNDCHKELNAKKTRKPVLKDKHTVERKCAVCQQEFDYRHELLKHARENHPNEKAFKCVICSMLFVNIISIARHRRIHKNLPLPRRHVCEVCDKSFSFKESLKRHLITHTRRTYYSCSLCLKSYKHKNSLENHKKIHIQTKSNDCHKLVNDKLTVERKCAVCQQEFDFSHELLKHARQNHPNAKALKCAMCSMLFANVYSITRHQRIHKQVTKKNSCPSKSIFHKDVNKRQLKVHIKNPSSQPAVERKCAVCHKEFHSRQDLIDHAQLYHPNAKAFKCGVCSMVFTNIHYISRHRRIHKDMPKKYSCESCSTSFIDKDSFNRHLKTSKHKNKIKSKSNNCNGDVLEDENIIIPDIKEKLHAEGETEDALEDICKTEFAYDETITNAASKANNRDILKDSPRLFATLEDGYISETPTSSINISKNLPKQHVCELCAQSFISRSHLRRHLSKHTWERPYSCTFCEKSYKRKDDMTTHQRKFHLNQYLKRRSKLKTNNDTDNIFKLKVNQDNLIINKDILNLNNHDNSQLDNLETSNIDCESMSFQINHDTLRDEETTNPIEVNESLTFIECNEENLSFLNNAITEEPFSNSSLKVQSVDCQAKRKCRFEENIEDIKHLNDKDENTLDTKSTFGINEENFSNSQSEDNRMKGDSLSSTDSKKEQQILKNNTYSTRRLKSNHELMEAKKCDLCKKTFSSHKDFVAHVEKCHANLEAFKCLNCDDLFSSSKSLSFHMKIAHKDLQNNYVCEFCSKSFDNVRNFKVHLRIHKGERSHPRKNINLDNKDSCENYPTDGLYLDNEEKEMKTFENTQVIKEECYSDSESIVNLEAKNIIEISKTEYQEGNELNYYLKTGPHLNDELLVEIPTKYKHKPKKQRAFLYDTVCAACDKTFDNQKQLVKHAQQFHPKGKVFRCLVCSSLHTSISQLRSHLDKLHGNAIDSNNEFSFLKKPFNCEFCDKSFNRNCVLQAHLRLHSVEVPYSCSLCRKMFKQRIHLLDHEESVHPKFKSTVCDMEISSNAVGFLKDVFSKR